MLPCYPLIGKDPVCSGSDPSKGVGRGGSRAAYPSVRPSGRDAVWSDGGEAQPREKAGIVSGWQRGDLPVRVQVSQGFGEACTVGSGAEINTSRGWARHDARSTPLIVGRVTVARTGDNSAVGDCVSYTGCGEGKNLNGSRVGRGQCGRCNTIGVPRWAEAACPNGIACNECIEEDPSDGRVLYRCLLVFCRVAAAWPSSNVCYCYRDCGRVTEYEGDWLNLLCYGHIALAGGSYWDSDA